MANSFLNNVISRIRKYADEPSINAKYDSASLLEEIHSAVQTVLTDINATSERPVRCRHTLTLTRGTDSYLLPPQVEVIDRIAKLDNETGLPIWWIEPRAHRSPLGPIVRVEGRCLRLDPKWLSTDETVEVRYIPNGDFRIHTGEIADSADITETSIVLAATPTLGELDTRENCYVGAIVRILTDPTNGFVQERAITAYDRTTRTATVEPAWDPIPAPDEGESAQPVVYEVVPLYSTLFENVMAWEVAMRLRAMQGDGSNWKICERMYARALRALRLSLGRAEGIVGSRFEQDTDVDCRR